MIVFNYFEMKDNIPYNFLKRFQIERPILKEALAEFFGTFILIVKIFSELLKMEIISY